MRRVSGGFERHTAGNGSFQPIAGGNDGGKSRLSGMLILLRSGIVMAPYSGADGQRSTLSSTISARNLPCSAVMRPTVMGRRKRRGPALPGLKKSVPFFVSILG
jgi:hypothetical protein